MYRQRLADAILLGAVLAALAVEGLVFRPGYAALRWVHGLGPLQRLQRRLARLPPGVALPLFLVPEAASRAGWVASVWLLMTGAAREALLVYVVTKLLAALTALWVYQACEPALLRVGWFNRLHGMVQRLRRRLLPRSPRMAALRQRVRLGQRPWLRPGPSA